MNTPSLPKRKSLRLKNYDYSESGAYFITICTKDKAKILCDIVGNAALSVPNVELTKFEEIVNQYIENINHVYENINVDKYIIMPNHIHMILLVSNTRNAVGSVPYQTSSTLIAEPAGNSVHENQPANKNTSDISISTIIHSLKALTSKACGKSIWQSSFHDRILRNEKEFSEIWDYIDVNPIKWNLDKYFM